MPCDDIEVGTIIRTKHGPKRILRKIVSIQGDSIIVSALEKNSRTRISEEALSKYWELADDPA